MLSAFFDLGEAQLFILDLPLSIFSFSVVVITSETPVYFKS